MVEHFKELLDNRESWFKHNGYQKQLKAKIYKVGSHLQELMYVSIGNHTSNKVGFLSKWFLKLHEMNKIEGCAFNITIVQAIPMNTLLTDANLPRDFANLTVSAQDNNEIRSI